MPNWRRQRITPLPGSFVGLTDADFAVIAGITARPDRSIRQWLADR
jgi:hypothetical protein